VASRRRRDSVSAAIENKPLHGTAVGADPPHEDAVVTVRVRRSLVGTPGGGHAVFAMNFGTRGEVNVELIANRIGGPLDNVGGLPRPDTFLDARTTIRSPAESLQRGE
jgi:hypothetical protein